MALNYANCAKEIFETLGGRENLVSAAHCATRLRLVTVDNSKIDLNALENIDGVKGVFESNGQLQLIIGTGTVNKVYEEFLAVSGMTRHQGRGQGCSRSQAARLQADDQGNGRCLRSHPARHRRFRI